MGMQGRTLMQSNLKLGQSLHANERELGHAASTNSRELKRCGWRTLCTPGIAVIITFGELQIAQGRGRCAGA